MHRISSAFFFVVLALSLAACTNDPVFDSQDVEVTIQDLPPLSAAEGHYEVWFSYPEDGVAGKSAQVLHGDQDYISMGTFIVAEDGTMMGVDGGSATLKIPDGYDPNLLIDAILTVETSSGSGDSPGPRFLAGPFTGDDETGHATLLITDAEAFGTRLDTANFSGTFSLVSPSTLTLSDDNQGIWFIDESQLPGLLLRNLDRLTSNTGWTYESWLVEKNAGASSYISLGQFADSGSFDANGAGPNAGPDEVFLGTPGEDFVQGTVRMLNDGTYGVIVSLQPKDLNLSHPFHQLLILPTLPAGLGTNVVTRLAIAPGEPRVELKISR